MVRDGWSIILDIWSIVLGWRGYVEVDGGVFWVNGGRWVWVGVCGRGSII